MSVCDNADTAGAYLLGALSEDEVYAFQLHLSGCELCQLDLRRLESAAGALGTAVASVAAPPELGDRIRRVVRAEAELLRAAGPEADRPAARRAFGSGIRLRPRLALAATLATGAVCGLIVGEALLGSATPRTHVISAAILQPGVPARASASLAVTGERGTLSVSDFPSPPAGHVYEVWLLGSGRSPRPTDALFSVDSRGSGTVAVPGSLRGVREILVTAEPDGGSQVPTRAPILSASIV